MLSRTTPLTLQSLFMRLKFYILLLAPFLLLTAQNKSVDQRVPVVKQESTWNKNANEQSSQTAAQTIAEGVAYSTNKDGIAITIARATGNVKLFSITGELVWAGNLVQGRFFIPTKPGIYFLRINNKSFKIVCK